ncbi:MAG: two-partner secretion domain-containing protein, partial [Planctomycetota bacterium]
MEKARNRPRERYFRNAIIYLLTCCLVLNTWLPAAMALEAIDVINSSGATPQQWGDHTIIDTDHGAIINWSNFNTSAGQSVKFNQYDGAALSTQSAVLNRIASASATQFDGALNANGRVFVVNPAGIVFGAGSTVNVAQLVASGLNMTDDAFNAVLADPANDMAFEGGSGEVENLGSIIAEKIYLVGKKVINRAVVKAQDGLIVMAAGNNVYMAQDGSNVLVELTGTVDTNPDIVNRSVINAPNGKIVLAAGDTLSRAIRLRGAVSAPDGTITARAARIESEGSITANGDAGSISLTGVETVEIDYWNTTGTGFVTANATGANGAGGTISLESQGTVNIAEQAVVQATGGTNSGDGGSISITAEDFAILGEIDASAGSTDDAPGTLQINTPNVTIANGANAGAIDTVYEQDIETLSDKGTSLVVNSEQGITIPDIVDGEIKGRYGNIELYTTDSDSFVSFADTSDTISTTLGDIIIGAGSGGLSIGNLETAKDVSDTNPTPGQIILSTSNRGNINVENLLIKDGWGHAEINVDSSGELTINGDVIVGGNSPILNIPNGQDAEAMIFLKSGDQMLLNGDITAISHGLNAGIEGGVTKAYVGIFAGTNETWSGDLTINGDLTAKAISSSVGTSDATIEIDSRGS